MYLPQKGTFIIDVTVGECDVWVREDLVGRYKGYKYTVPFL